MDQIFQRYICNTVNVLLSQSRLPDICLTESSTGDLQVIYQQVCFQNTLVRLSIFSLVLVKLLPLKMFETGFFSFLRCRFVRNLLRLSFLSNRRYKFHIIQHINFFIYSYSGHVQFTTGFQSVFFSSDVYITSSGQSRFARSNFLTLIV